MVEFARAVEDRGPLARCTSPSTRTSRRVAARPRPPATTSSRRSTSARSIRSSRSAMAAAVDRAPRGRHRHLPRRAARADRDGQGGRHARRAVGRPLRVRRRLRLERGRRSRVTASTCSDPARHRARARARDAALWRDDVGEFHGELRRPRAVVVVAEAGDARWPTGAHRWRGRPEAVRARRRVRRRLDPDRRAPACATRSRTCSARAKRADRDPQTLRIVPFGTVPDARARSSTTRRSGSPRSCCASRAALATRCWRRLDRYAELVGS